MQKKKKKHRKLSPELPRWRTTQDHKFLNFEVKTITLNLQVQLKNFNATYLP